MVLLLFLVSVAVVYYIVPPPPAAELASEQDALPVAAQDAFTPIATPGLLALGEALSRYGQGRAPEFGETKEAAEAREPVVVSGKSQGWANRGARGD